MKFWQQWFDKSQKKEHGNPWIKQADDLIEMLLGLITNPKKASKVISTIESYQKLNQTEKEAQLPAVYFLLEQYLSEVEAGYVYNFATIRKRVVKKFPVLLEKKNFKIIFLEKDEQELHLCRFFLYECINKARPILGGSLQSALDLVNSDDWDYQALYRIIKDEVKYVTESESEKINYLRHISHGLYSKLDKIVGPSSASGVFEKSFERAYEIYGGLDNFPVIVNLMPEHVLDDKKISILNRRQMQQALLVNIEELQKSNQALEKKNAELELLNTQLKKARIEVEQANQAKSLFLASMSHELRTPLNVVIGFSQLLERDKTLSEEHKKYISTMHRSGNHLLGMINDVLDISKIESGLVEIIPTKFNLHTLLIELKQMFTMMASEKMLDLILEPLNNIPKWIYADENKIRQIIINLLSNAVKYTDSGKVIISPKFDRFNNILSVKVSDTGIGIENKFLDKIFEPFRQVHGNYSKGTGLGLSITKKLANLLHGDIQVKSVVDVGSDFIFTLPIETVEEVSVPKRIDYNQGVTGLKGDMNYSVLVVDDVPENRYLITSMLKNVGFKIIEAKSGLEAIDILKSTSVDLILMDLFMPGLSGYETFELIRSDKRTNHIPVLAVTAGVLTSGREEVLEKGFDGFISKPIKDGNLYGQIAELLHIEYIFDKDSLNITDDSELDNSLRLANIIINQPDSVIAEIKEALELNNFKALRSKIPFSDLDDSLKKWTKNAISDKNYKFILDLDESIEKRLNKRT